MYKLYLLTFLTSFLVSAKAQSVFKITDYGASTTVNAFGNAASIQNAINACSNAGGGTVLVDSGNFVTNTFILKSNVTLRILQGASLTAHTINNDYPEYPYNQPSWSDNNYTKRSLIFAQEANNIRITGGGTIFFSGRAANFLSVSKNFRPFGIRMHRCKNVVIDSIKLENAAHWMVHLFNCDTITIRKINIYNHCFGSNDGINIDGSRNVLIEDCDIDSNDDPIVIKTHSLAAAEDVLVRNCTLATYERAIKVGNESCGPMRRIRFENIVVKKSAFGIAFTPANAIYVGVTDGGLAEDISFENIDIQTPYETPIFIRLSNRGNKYTSNIPPPPVQYLKNVTIKNFRCESARAIPSSITAMPNFFVENILLENITLIVKGDSGIVGLQTVPELATSRPEPDMWGDSLPAHGFYVRHAKNVQFKNVCISLKGKDNRPEYYFEDTANVFKNDCTNPYNSIAEFANPHALKLFPNPAQKHLNIKSDLIIENAKIVLFDITGRQYNVSIEKTDEYSLTLNIENLEKGFYFIQIANEKLNLSNSFIKQ